MNNLIIKKQTGLQKKNVGNIFELSLKYRTNHKRNVIELVDFSPKPIYEVTQKSKRILDTLSLKNEYK